MVLLLLQEGVDLIFQQEGATCKYVHTSELSGLHSKHMTHEVEHVVCRGSSEVDAVFGVWCVEAVIVVYGGCGV